MGPTTFRDLIARIRSGDHEAVRLLQEEYGEALEREVRFALYDSRLRRIIGESDVCQSVLMRFCVGLWAGNYEIETPAQLLALLKTMVRSRVVDWARYAKSDRRDIRRSEPLGDFAGNVSAAVTSLPAKLFPTRSCSPGFVPGFHRVISGFLNSGRTVGSGLRLRTNLAMRVLRRFASSTSGRSPGFWRNWGWEVPTNRIPTPDQSRPVVAIRAPDAGARCNEFQIRSVRAGTTGSAFCDRTPTPPAAETGQDPDLNQPVT